MAPNAVDKAGWLERQHNTTKSSCSQNYITLHHPTSMNNERLSISGRLSTAGEACIPEDKRKQNVRLCDFSMAVSRAHRVPAVLGVDTSVGDVDDESHALSRHTAHAPRLAAPCRRARFCGQRAVRSDLRSQTVDGARIHCRCV